MRACIVADPTLGRYLEGEREAWGNLPGLALSFFIMALPEESGGWKAEAADLYVLPAALLLDLGEALPRPVFAYGPVCHVAECLRCGATDYLRSPWTLEELAARASRLENLRFRLRGSPLALSGRKLSSGPRSLVLSEAESRLARLLALNLDRPVPRAALSLGLWGDDRLGSRAIDVHISCLRKKLEGLSPGSGSCLRACRRQGYRLEGEACG
jgi:DNA-binding winged helix-turn-helix (wHTH) protein